jgi:hypothetical protein
MAGWGAATSLFRTKYYSGDQIEKNVMGGAHVTIMGERKRVQGFGGERKKLL